MLSWKRVLEFGEEGWGPDGGEWGVNGGEWGVNGGEWGANGGEWGLELGDPKAIGSNPCILLS